MREARLREHRPGSIIGNSVAEGERITEQQHAQYARRFPDLPDGRVTETLSVDSVFDLIFWSAKPPDCPRYVPHAEKRIRFREVSPVQGFAPEQLGGKQPAEQLESEQKSDGHAYNDGGISDQSRQ